MAYDVFTPEQLSQRGLEALEGSHEAMLRKHRFIELAGGVEAAPYCHLWAPLAAGILKSELRLFEPRATVEVPTWVRGTDAQHLTEATYHTFVRFALPDIEPVVADGTWQQLVPEERRTKSLPRVASGTFEEVQELAGNAGVDHRLLKIWDPAHTDSVIRL